jgi:hypothetical protein
VILFIEAISPAWFKLTVQTPATGSLVFFAKTRDQVTVKWHNYRLAMEQR